MKNGTISSRASIVQRSKGQSAVEQSAYISRTSMYSEYCGMTYNRTGKEDLVGAGVLLPDNAPVEYKDRAILWNSVEQYEKSKNAQLARSLKYSLPNEWNEETAKQAMEAFILEQFTSKGMCADYGIHRSFNEQGQANLHIHILLTMRPLNEDGTWGAKSKKDYILDKDGNKIRNASGKGFKSRKVDIVDWNEKGKAKEWRTAIADKINEVNEQIGVAERVDPRSYKEREIPLIPTIHLGEKASALERRGIPTERGNINRTIREYNSLIMKIYKFLRELRAEIKKGLFRLAIGKKEDTQKINPSISSYPQNEVRRALQLLQGRMAEMAVRPIFPYVQKFKDSTPLSNIADLEKLIEQEKLNTWEDVNAYEQHQEVILGQCRDKLAALNPEYRKWIQAVSDYEEPAEDVKTAQGLLKRIDDLAERREKNPLTKVEELEEANYNQIDGVLNNMKAEKQEKTDTKGMSIMEKLEANKEKQEQAGKEAKKQEKKPEIDMD